jgi:hypothetical protein
MGIVGSFNSRNVHASILTSLLALRVVGAMLSRAAAITYTQLRSRKPPTFWGQHILVKQPWRNASIMVKLDDIIVLTTMTRLL